MRFYGTVPLSFIDYPEKIAYVIFTHGCNLHCGYCHNLGSKPSKLQRTEVMLDLLARKEFIDGVVVSGGEPLINSDLDSLLEEIKGLGFPIKLDTNGTFPSKLAGLIDKQLVDYVALDIKSSRHGYGSATSSVAFPFSTLLESVEILKTGKIPYEFRTVVVPTNVNPFNLEDIIPVVKGAARYRLLDYRPEYANSEKERSVQAYTSTQILDLAQRIVPHVKELWYNSTLLAKNGAPVDQWIDRNATNVEATGSSPVGRAISGVSDVR
jgi:pyruvate formate lyase activating enzyme